MSALRVAWPYPARAASSLRCSALSPYLCAHAFCSCDSRFFPSGTAVVAQPARRPSRAKNPATSCSRLRLARSTNTNELLTTTPLPLHSAANLRNKTAFCNSSALPPHTHACAHHYQNKKRSYRPHRQQTPARLPCRFSLTSTIAGSSFRTKAARPRTSANQQRARPSRKRTALPRPRPPQTQQQQTSLAAQLRRGRPIDRN